MVYLYFSCKVQTTIFFCLSKRKNILRKIIMVSKLEARNKLILV